MARYLSEESFSQRLSIPVAKEGRGSSVSPESLFRSARGAPGGEMLGVGVALLFFVLVGGSLLGSYLMPDHQLPVAVPAATVVSPPQPSVVDRTVRGTARGAPSRPHQIDERHLAHPWREPTHAALR
jgi:hypothetical protein